MKVSASGDPTDKTCAICMDNISSTKTLPCSRILGYRTCNFSDEPFHVATYWVKGLTDNFCEIFQMKASASGDPSDKTCAICMDDISSPKTLVCGHTFCTDCINHYLDNYKQACPTCGKVCGIIKGDQPKGDMFVNFNKYSNCAGYEDVGRIDITYSFQAGSQKVI